MIQDKKYDYDLFVIGAGSGGVRASRMSAGYGARVAIAEDYRVGGTCVIRGCVPKKLLSYAAHFHEDFEDAEGYGWTSKASEGLTCLPAAAMTSIRRIAVHIDGMPSTGGTNMTNSCH